MHISIITHSISGMPMISQDSEQRIRGVWWFNIADKCRLTTVAGEYSATTALKDVLADTHTETTEYDGFGRVKSVRSSRYDSGKLLAESNIAYDGAGNLVSDPSRSVDTVLYNSIGLPREIKVRGGSGVKRLYSADGRLLRTVVRDTGMEIYEGTLPGSGKPTRPGTSAGLGTLPWDFGSGQGVTVDIGTRDTTDYRGPLRYLNGSLDRRVTPSGYVKADTAYYFVTDHQGNVRLVVRGTDGSVVQEAHYYPYGGLFGESSATTLEAVNGIGENDRLFGGKERTALSDLQFLDFEARLYDPQLGMFWTCDPMMEDMPYASPYIYCLGNPVNLTDLTGLKPSKDEAACMAAYVYGDKYKKVSLIGGWTPELDSKFNIGWGEGESGLRTMLFSRTMDGETEYALAFAGTDFPEDLNDLWNDFAQPFGFSEQYATAMNMSKELKNELNGAELTFVGHSLGGGLSTAAAYAIGGRAITFNPAGVTPFTRIRNKASTVDAYVNPNDWLHFINKWLINGNANGNVHMEKGNFNLSKFLSDEGHSIYTFIKPYYKEKKK